MKNDKSKKKDFPPLQLASLGITIAVGFCIFVLGGMWLDKKLNTGIVLTLTGGAFAFILAIYELLKTAKAAK